MTSRRSALAAIGSALGLTGVSWASTSANVSLAVDRGGLTQDGQIASIRPATGDLREQRGQGGATTKAGYQLYEITLPDASRSDEIRIPIDFLNPQDVGGVLRNPHAYLEVAVWHEAASSSFELGDGVPVTKDAATATRFSQSRASAILYPTVSGASPLYVVARVMTPGGSPPGQQASGTFRFDAEVKS